jgi:predicted ABC-type ATPase
MRSEKRIVIIAGSNGAGKTTFAREFLPNEADCPVFVNADLIAEGLSPFEPTVAAIRAGRVMVDEIRRHARQGESFSFETTLAGRRYARMIPAWRRIGYRVKLIFLWLPKAEIALERVAIRVSQGGHNVPEDVVRRRFEAGWRNFQAIYRPIVDCWVLYNNAGGKPVLIDEGQRT